MIPNSGNRFSDKIMLRQDDQSASLIPSEWERF